jgi:hypothetical protein
MDKAMDAAASQFVPVIGFIEYPSVRIPRGSRLLPKFARPQC